MNHTPEALQLARELDTKAQALGCPLDRFSDALRHQHARIADLEAQLYAIGAGGVGQSIKPPVQADTAQAPVAWRVHPFDYGVGSKGVYALTQMPEQVEVWQRKEWKVEPLYTAPQPTENLRCKSTQKRLATLWGYEKARQPLTDEQINTLKAKAVDAQPWERKPSWVHLFARAIEAAHGITGGQQ